MDKLAQTFRPPGRIDLAREADFRIGELRVRPSRREIDGLGARHQLQRRVMQVLVALAHSTNAVVSQRELTLRCWGGLFVTDDAIGRCISQLRRLASTWAEPPFAIETIAGVGYRLEPAADWQSALGGRGEAAPPRTGAFRISPLRWAAVAAVLCVAGVGAWLLRDRIGSGSAGPAETRVAVLPFDAPGSSRDVNAFANGLLDAVLDALSNDHIETVSRIEDSALRGPNAGTMLQRLGVGLLLDGSVEGQNGLLTVRLRLDDPSRRAIVWSEEFSRPTAEADALQAEVAARAARITTQALGARAAGVGDPAALSDFVTGDERQRFNWVGGSVEAEPFFRRVIGRAPRFAGGHAYLAISDAIQSQDPGNPRAAEQKVEAAREAQTALRLDPKGYAAFLGLYLIKSPTDWRGREQVLQRGAMLDPTEPSYPYFESTELAQQGRLRAAAETARRAVALDAFWPGPTMVLGLCLKEIGQESEGQQIFDRMERFWPKHGATLDGRFIASSLYGDPDAALALLANPQTRPTFTDPRSADLWRVSLNALKSSRADQRAGAAAQVKAAADAQTFLPVSAVVLLVRLGDVDGAFAVANNFVDQVEFTGFVPVLFISQTAPLRKDPRFMKLAARLGLVDYWRSTGNWPDFCRDPGLPYDCKSEALRALKA